MSISFFIDRLQYTTRFTLRNSFEVVLIHGSIIDCLKFYSELSPVPRAKYPIQVCCSPACRVNRVDSHRLISTLERLLDIKLGETTYDGRFTLEQVTCIGACDRAPAVRINGHVYDHLDTQEKIETLLRSLP